MSREQRYEDKRFAAAMQGIDLDEGNKESAKNRFEEVQARAQARLSGVDPEQQDMFTLGLEFEIEE